MMLWASPLVLSHTGTAPPCGGTKEGSLGRPGHHLRVRLQVRLSPRGRGDGEGEGAGAGRQIRGAGLCAGL